jgi:hypothetical protein
MRVEIGLIPFFIMAGLLCGGLPLMAAYKQNNGVVPDTILFPVLIIFTAVVVVSLGLMFSPCDDGE